MKKLKDFMRKGNVWPMAAGVTIGLTAWGFMQSLVGGVIDPLLSNLFGRTNLSQEAAIIGEGSQMMQVAWGSTIVLAASVGITLLVIWLVIELKDLWNKRMSGSKKK